MKLAKITLLLVLSVISHIFAESQSKQNNFSALSVKIYGDKFYFYSPTKKMLGTVTFFKGDIKDTSSDFTKYYTIHKTIGIGDLKWSIKNDFLFVAMKKRDYYTGRRFALLVFRYPINKMISNRPGKECLPPFKGKKHKLFISHDEKGNYIFPYYGEVGSAFLYGTASFDYKKFLKGNSIAYTLTLPKDYYEFSKDAFCDIRIVNGDTIQIYVEKKGELLSWFYNGFKCTKKKEYKRKINGPFKICSNGRSLIFQTKRQWIIVRDIEKPDKPLYLFPVETYKKVPLFIDYSDKSETYLIQNNSYVRIDDKGNIKQGKLKDVETIVKNACKKVWGALGDFDPLKQKIAIDDHKKKRIVQSVLNKPAMRKARLEKEKIILAQMITKQHINEKLRRQASQVIQDKGKSSLKDDMALILLLGIDKLDGTEALIESYITCLSHLKGIQLEGQTKREWKEYKGLRKSLNESLGGDLIGLYARYIILEELREQAEILKQKKGNEKEIKKIRKFIAKEAKMLLEELNENDFQDMIKELAEEK